MSQTGYTPIQLYNSSTASSAPIAGNLAAGELAINNNTADGKLYYKDSAGVVQLLASRATTSGTFTDLAYTSTLTGSTGILNIGSGQVYKDASGNVGIGTSSPISALEIKKPNTVVNNRGIVAINTTNTAAADIGGSLSLGGENGQATTPYVFGAIAGRYEGTLYNGYLQFNTAAGGAGTVSEKMRIDSSGNVGIGTSSPSAKLSVAGNLTLNTNYAAWNGAVTAMQASNCAVWTNNYTTGFTANIYYDSTYTRRAILSNYCGELVYNSSSAGGWDFNVAGVSTAGAVPAMTTAMRIDSSGNLLVGTTVVGAAGGITMRPNLGGAGTYARITLNHSVVTSSDVFSFEYLGTQVGRINVGTTITSYITTSDQRLKENIVDAPSALASIKAIQVRSFDWKSTGEHQEYGYIAQELLGVAPEVVSVPTNEDEMMGVDFGRLTPRLVKAIQEQQTLIEALTARLTKAGI